MKTAVASSSEQGFWNTKWEARHYNVPREPRRYSEWQSAAARVRSWEELRTQGAVTSVLASLVSGHAVLTAAVHRVLVNIHLGKKLQFKMGLIFLPFFPPFVLSFWNSGGITGLNTGHGVCIKVGLMGWGGASGTLTIEQTGLTGGFSWTRAQWLPSVRD